METAFFLTITSEPRHLAIDVLASTYLPFYIQPHVGHEVGVALHAAQDGRVVGRRSIHRAAEAVRVADLGDEAELSGALSVRRSAGRSVPVARRLQGDRRLVAASIDPLGQLQDGRLDAGAGL